MKKHLIAAAVAAAVSVPAMAQNVTLSGMLKPGLEQQKRTNRNSQTQVEDQSSRFLLNGTEDLGGGLRAIFQVDTRFGTDQMASTNAVEVGAGNTWLGLTGSFGEFRIGRNDLHYNEQGFIDGATNAAGNLDASAGAGILSQVNGTAVAVTSRSSNVMMFDTPTMNGFRARVAISTNFAGVDGLGGARGGDKTASGYASNYVLRYNQGVHSLVGSYWDGKSDTRAATNTDQKATIVGGQTTIGGARIGAVYNKSELRVIGGTTTNRTGWGLGLDYPMSPAITLHATYASVAGIKVNNVTTANSGADHLTIGATYALSKRTSAGVYYTKLDNDTAGTYNLFSGNTVAVAGNAQGVATAGDTISSFYAGLRHTF